MKRNVCLFIILIFVLNTTVFVLANGEFTKTVDSNDASKFLEEIQTEAYIVFEIDRGQTLYQNNQRKLYYSQLISTIMTNLLALENLSTTQSITASKSIYTSYTNTFFILGEEYPLNSLLSTQLISSSPEISDLIANFMRQDKPEFVSLMNEKASTLNLSQTKFTSPTGLDGMFQHTSISDLKKLIMYALSNPKFNDMFKNNIFVWDKLNDVENAIITNENGMFWVNDYVNGGIRGNEGLKRFTTITSASVNNLTLVCILLNTTEDSYIKDTNLLLENGFNQFRRGILLKKGENVTEHIVDNQILTLSSNTDIYYTYPIGKSYIEQIDFELLDLTPPVNKDQIAGSAKYLLKDGSVISVNLYPNKSIPLKETIIDKLEKTLSKYNEVYNIIKLLLLIEALIIIFRVFSNLKNLHKKKTQ